MQRNHSSIGNSILPDKDGAMSNNRDGVLTQELPSGGQTPTPSFKQFTFTELKSITKNFSKERILISKGSHVVAFKGWIDENTYTPSEVGVGMAVVVKEITLNEYQDPGLRQILEFLRNCSHPNLVKLLGYCTESEYSRNYNMFLVHEYMQKGSLDNHLFRKGAEPLSWHVRLKIAIGAARGLAFLHTIGKLNMYSKFEASDILLDKDFNAKLSDFGMQEICVAGDPSSYDPLYYVPGAEPKFINTHRLRKGIGVRVMMLLLQCLLKLAFKILSAYFIIGGCIRQEVDEDWTGIFFTGPITPKSKLIEMEFRQTVQFSGASQVARLVLRCLDTKPRSRPSMEEVLSDLETIEKETSS
ncbi:hypothetical protein RJ639_009921 [Escallonia herrerae]|uniref:Protein kinase domain-containing protein n=1 Tax=Escallonia herrerae TaxID=1293975 RepID=A0AA88VTD4_9ASTE|nr:hypothetical protein RJ639_009921 [Escallonia herrerae]